MPGVERVHPAWSELLGRIVLVAPSPSGSGGIDGQELKPTSAQAPGVAWPWLDPDRLEFLLFGLHPVGADANVHP